MRIIEAFRGKREEMKTDQSQITPESPHDAFVEKLLEDLRDGFITEYYTESAPYDDEFLWRRRLSVVLKKGRKKFLVKLEKLLPNGEGYLRVEDYIPKMTNPNYDTALKTLRVHQDELWCSEGYQSKITFTDGSYNLYWQNSNLSPEGQMRFPRDVFRARVDKSATTEYFDLCKVSTNPDVNFRWPHFEDQGNK